MPYPMPSAISCLENNGGRHQPRPPNVAHSRAFWSLLDGTWDVLKGSLAVEFRYQGDTVKDRIMGHVFFLTPCISFLTPDLFVDPRMASI